MAAANMADEGEGHGEYQLEEEEGNGIAQRHKTTDRYERKTSVKSDEEEGETEACSAETQRI